MLYEPGQTGQEGGRAMTVYADEAFLLNGAVDYLLLRCAAGLGGGSQRRERLLLAAAFGGLYAAAALFAPLSVLQNPLMKLVSLGVMLLLAFGARQESLRAGVLFIAAACAFGGASLVCAQCFRTGVVVLPGGTYYAVSALGLVLLAGLCYGLCRTVFACTAQHGGEIHLVELYYDARQVTLRALHDTGCTLCDPISGERVIVAQAEALRALLPQVHFAPCDLEDAAQLLVRLRKQIPTLPVRLLRYQSVGTNAGLLLCLRCERKTRRGRARCLVAFSPTPVSTNGSYDALMGGAMG